MKRTAARPKIDAEVKDVQLEHACILCGGDIELRITPSGACTYCRACRWVSHPHMRRDGHRVHVVHPAGGQA
jgi:hypothetical protein